MAKDSFYDKDSADYAVSFIESLRHTKGQWYREPFELIDWQEQIVRDVFGVLKAQRLPAVQHRLCGNPEEDGQKRTGCGHRTAAHLRRR
jgi:hypothetical protein